LGWQAELGTAENRCGTFEMVAGVGLDGMHIAPGALNRIAEKDDTAPAGF